MPHSPPLPIGATFSSGTNLLTVTFDRTLTGAPISGANWTGRYSGQLYSGPVGPGMVAAGNRVLGTMAPGIVNPGADVTHFNPPPFDVLSSFGIPAAAFADFPTVVIP